MPWYRKIGQLIFLHRCTRSLPMLHAFSSAGLFRQIRNALCKHPRRAHPMPKRGLQEKHSYACPACTRHLAYPFRLVLIEASCLQVSTLLPQRHSSGRTRSQARPCLPSRPRRIPSPTLQGTVTLAVLFRGTLSIPTSVSSSLLHCHEHNIKRDAAERSTVVTTPLAAIGSKSARFLVTTSPTPEKTVMNSSNTCLIHTCGLYRPRPSARCTMQQQGQPCCPH